MPRPHFPPHGGHHPASCAQGTRPAAGATAGGSGAGPNVHALEAEVARLKRELQSARKHGSGKSHVWMALATLGAGLLFAVLAILHRGQ